MKKHIGQAEPSLEWTWEQVQAAQAQWISEYPGEESSRTCPLTKWDAIQRIESRRKQFDAGDQGALMAALRVCACHEIVMPEWVASAYIKAYDQVLTCREKSWNVVFGAPFPKGANINARRKKRVLMFAVLNAVNHIRSSDDSRTIDAHLFEEVGAKFSIGKTLAEEYYRAALSLVPRVK